MERSLFDPVAKTLTITEGFRKKMQDMESEEFQYYSKMVESVPGLKVLNRTHKTPRTYTTKDGQKFGCNPGKNLKYKNMETFIAGLPNSKQYMEEYKFLKERAAIVQTSRHNVVKKWFLAQFPDFRKNPLLYVYQNPNVVSAEQFVTHIGTDYAAPALAATAGIVQ
jgi:hypothetical protein